MRMLSCSIERLTGFTHTDPLEGTETNDEQFGAQLAALRFTHTDPLEGTETTGLDYAAECARALHSYRPA